MKQNPLSRRNRKKVSVTSTVIAVFFILVSLSMLIPFWNTLVTSLSPESENMEPVFRLIPKTFSLDGYKGILAQEKLIRAFFINVYITIAGTLLHLFFCCLAGYALSQRDFWGRKAIFSMIIISMVLPGQVMMVPSFVLYRTLGLLDNIQVMVVSGMISAFSILLFRNFFLSVPKSMHDAALLDGAGEFNILFRVYLPMAKPGLATVALFQFVGKWNTFFEGVLYINDAEKQPLQVVLSEIVATFANNNPGASAAAGGSMLGENMQSAAVIIAIIPLILIYPLLQKYFVKGIMVGAIKE